MGTVSLPIGATNSGTNDWSDVHGEDQAIVDVLNGSVDATNLASNAVTTAKILDANVTDAKLASPNTSLYKDIYQWPTTLVGPDSLAVTGYVTNQTGFAASPLTNPAPASQFAGVALNSSYYAVTGKTASLVLVCTILCNATAPGTNFTYGLYPLTIAGAADTFTMTAGTIAAGSSTAINAPSASTVTTAVTSSAFAFPSAGFYGLGISLSGAQANNSACMVTARLQVHHT